MSKVKFVQILTNPNDDLCNLYALDDKGRVWYGTGDFVSKGSSKVFKREWRLVEDINDMPDEPKEQPSDS